MSYALEGIEGRVVLVTGAGRGIGRTYAKAFAEAGAKVAISDILEEEGTAAAQELVSAGFEATFVKADISDPDSASACVRETVAHFGALHILVNNAALYGGLAAIPAQDIDPQRFNQVLGINVTGTWLMAKAAFPIMAEQGSGVIVNQSSIAAFVGHAMHADYVASKGAVNTMTRSLARDFGPFGIRVNALAPGGIDTQATIDKWDGNADAFVESAKTKQIIARGGTPQDLIGPMLFLASEASEWMTGQVIIADGGMFLLG